MSYAVGGQLGGAILCHRFHGKCSGTLGPPHTTPFTTPLFTHTHVSSPSAFPAPLSCLCYSFWFCLCLRLYLCVSLRVFLFLSLSVCQIVWTIFYFSTQDDKDSSKELGVVLPETSQYENHCHRLCTCAKTRNLTDRCKKFDTTLQSSSNICICDPFRKKTVTTTDISISTVRSRRDFWVSTRHAQTSQ